MALIYFSRISQWALVIIAFPVGLLSFASVKMRNGRIYSVFNLISLRKPENLILDDGIMMLLI